MIDAGADVNIQNNYGSTALILSSLGSRYLKTVQLLIEAGADWNIKNKHDKDFLDYLCDEYIKIIIKYYPEKYKEYLIKKNAEKYNL